MFIIFLIKPDILPREIIFVHEYLTIKSDETLAKFEDLLNKEVKKRSGRVFQPMAFDELHAGIDRPEEDFADGSYTEGKEVLSRFRQCK